MCLVSLLTDALFDFVVQGESLILVAAALGRPEVVRTLVEAKIDINGRNNKARTPLFQTSVCFCALCCTKSYIDIDNNVQGVTAVFAACLNGRTETVKALVQLKANINECNQKAIDLKLTYLSYFALA